MSVACNCTTPGWVCDDDYRIDTTGQCQTLVSARLAVLFLALLSSGAAGVFDMHRASRLYFRRVDPVAHRAMIVALGALLMHLTRVVVQLLKIVGGRYEHEDAATAILNGFATGLATVIVGEILLRFVIIMMRDAKLGVERVDAFHRMLRLAQCTGFLFTGTIYVVDFVQDPSVQIVFVRLFGASVVVAALMLGSASVWVSTVLIALLDDHGKKASTLGVHADVTEGFGKAIARLRRLRLFVTAAIMACFALAVVIMIVYWLLQYLLPMMFVSDVCLFWFYYYRVDAVLVDGHERSPSGERTSSDPRPLGRV